MIETILRPLAQPLFDLVGMFFAYKVTPTTITLLACLFGISSGIATAGSYFLLGACLLWISGLCDVLDGTVARLTNTAHPLGGYLDLISDRMVEAAFICGFAYALPTLLWPGMIFFVSVLLHFSTFMAASALFENNGIKSMHYDISLVERAEAFIAFSGMAVWPAQAKIILWTLNGAILLTALSRLVRIMKKSQSAFNPGSSL
jgi:phosphatidylglycerophosphate synthase